MDPYPQISEDAKLSCKARVAFVFVLALLFISPSSSSPARTGDINEFPLAEKACLGTLKGDELITVDEDVVMLNHEFERRGPLRAPIMELRPGQQYQVVVDFKGASRYAVFDRFDASKLVPWT